jgi:hypothetical protein
MHARQPRNDNAQKRRLDSLRHRCLQRAQQKRQELLLTTRLQPGGRSPAAADAAHWREIVHAELNAVGRSERAAGAAWSEVDEALLQQQLGTDGYLELMMATEEALVRELDADLAQLGADGSAREYEAFLAHEAAVLAASADEQHSAPQGEEAVLCPLCMRGTLVLLADRTTIVCDRAAADGGGCNLLLDARGHPAPLEAVRQRMCLLLGEHAQRCGGCAYGRLPTLHEQAAGAPCALFLSCAQCGVNVPVV